MGPEGSPAYDGWEAWNAIMERRLKIMKTFALLAGTQNSWRERAENALCSLSSGSTLYMAKMSIY